MNLDGDLGGGRGVGPIFWRELPITVLLIGPKLALIIPRKIRMGLLQIRKVEMCTIWWEFNRFPLTVAKRKELSGAYLHPSLGFPGSIRQFFGIPLGGFARLRGKIYFYPDGIYLLLNGQVLDYESLRIIYS